MTIKQLKAGILAKLEHAYQNAHDSGNFNDAFESGRYMAKYDQLFALIKDLESGLEDIPGWSDT